MTDIIKQLTENVIVCGEMPQSLQTLMFSMPITEFERRDYNDWVKCHSTDEFEGCFTFRLRSDYKDKPEIEEYAIDFNRNANYQYYIRENERCISDACDDPDFIGFKFEDGKIARWPIRYIDARRTLLTEITMLSSPFPGFVKMLHATHVLFRGPK